MASQPEAVSPPGVERWCSGVSWAETVWVTRVGAEALAAAGAH